jgi:hypothetical protein
MIASEVLERLASIGCVLGRAPASTVTGGRSPDWIVEPGSVEHLAEVVRLLASAGTPWRVDALGRNWGYDDSRVRSAGLIVRLARLKQFSVDVDLGLVTVQSGVTFGDVSAALEEDGRWWLPAPSSGPHTSLLGNALDRGLLSGLGERERHCRDFLVMDRVDGSLCRLGWADDVNPRVRRALPYPPGPHRQGELFQATGHGPVVVELTHALAVRPGLRADLAFLSGTEPTEGLLACWRAALREDLMADCLLQPAQRRRMQAVATTHEGLTLKFSVTGRSGPLLRAKMMELQSLARSYGQRLTVNNSGTPDDLAMIGGCADRPDTVGAGAAGVEWRTVGLPFVPSAVIGFWRAIVSEPDLAELPWTLRPLDQRALVWTAPLVYLKGDRDSRHSLERRARSLERIRRSIGLPEYRTGAVRSAA